MTTASELKRAAVVEVENKASEVTAENEAQAVNMAVTKRDDATEQEERCCRGYSRQVPNSFSFGSTGSTGSTTATATSQVAARKAQSGSKAAITCTAASMQATGLPVTVFSNKSRQIPIQQNPVPLWPIRPERALRARSAA